MGVVPAAVTAGSAIYGAIKSKSHGYASGSGRQDQATGILQNARQSSTNGNSLFSTGAPLIAQAASYYRRLLSGDPQLEARAVAPQRAALTESYKGAESGLEASTLRGGARDYARADLSRQKAGQLGLLIPNAINQAIPQAAGVGLEATGQGQNSTSAGGSLYAQLLGLSQQQNATDFSQSSQIGGGISGFLNNLLQTYYAGKGGGQAASPAATTQASFFNPRAAFGGVSFGGG